MLFMFMINLNLRTFMDYNILRPGYNLFNFSMQPDVLYYNYSFFLFLFFSFYINNIVPYLSGGCKIREILRSNAGNCKFV